MDWYNYFDMLDQGKFAEAEEARMAEIPNRLLKFISLDDNNKNNEDKLKSLENNQIWLSAVNEFNDPYEFKGMYLNKKALKEYGFSNAMVKQFDELFDSTLKEYGVTCLSGCAVSNFPMWAYYTNNYRGFAIEYELNTKICLHKVIYEPNRIPVARLIYSLIKSINKSLRETGNPSNVRSEVFIRILLQNLYIKSSSWAHEDEYRIVQPVDNKKGQNYDIDKLGMRTKRIIVGKNCSMNIAND